MENLLKWLPLISVAAAGAVGYGAQQQKITSIEQAIVVQAQQQAKFVETQVEEQKAQAASDARQQMIIELLQEIRQKVDK